MRAKGARGGGGRQEGEPGELVVDLGEPVLVEGVPEGVVAVEAAVGEAVEG